jgi:hypothetical protein
LRSIGKKRRNQSCRQVLTPLRPVALQAEWIWFPNFGICCIRYDDDHWGILSRGFPTMTREPTSLYLHYTHVAETPRPPLQAFGKEALINLNGRKILTTLFSFAKQPIRRDRIPAREDRRALERWCLRCLLLREQLPRLPSAPHYKSESDRRHLQMPR